MEAKEGGDDMRQKMKPDFDPEVIQSDLIEKICSEYNAGASLRSIGKDMKISPMKVRKILITGGVYSTDLSDEIYELYRDGRTVFEIAELLDMTTANVNSYLPYERIVYKMEERSVEADRQQRYRDRKKGLLPEIEVSKELPKIERKRDKTMLFVIGKKLRKVIPSGVFDSSSDPLAKYRSTTWGTNTSGEFVLHEPDDPDKSIWCAELTTSGRGKGKKQGVVLMSANSGFAVIAPLPQSPVIIPVSEEMKLAEQRDAVKENERKVNEYREELEMVFIDSIKSGLLSFALPEARVLDYTDTIGRVELIKGRRSFPGIRLEELIERELQWDSGTDPVEGFNVRGNWTNRKFGNSGDYRHVDAAVRQMLGLTPEEDEAWLTDFLRPIRESMTN